MLISIFFHQFPLYLLNLHLVDLANSTSQPALGIPALFGHWNYWQVTTPSWSFCGCWRSELRFLCLYSEHFCHWLTSLAPEAISDMKTVLYGYVHVIELRCSRHL